MKLIRDIYRTSKLSEYGRFILAALLVIVFAGYFIIPTYEVQHVQEQLIKLKGKHFRFDDDPHVTEFLRSVKDRDGYICMGTSESTTLRDGNYYDFLDQDTSYETRFSILGGAGRTCGMHMPMLLNHKEDVKDLKLIYFINPVYWRSELNHFDKGYWTRYLNYGVYRNTLDHDTMALLKNTTTEYDEVLNPGEKFLHYGEAFLRKLRKPFFHDLRYRVKAGSYHEDLEYLAGGKAGFGQYAFFGEIDTSYIDTSWNITHEFKHRTWLNPMVDNDYRNRELVNFIRLCKTLEVDITYLLGPVNEIYIQKYHPEYLPGYKSKVNMIRSLLDKEQVDYIDLTYLGSVPGSFIDNQHHSSYGAFLIYQDIKKYLYEKGDL